MAVFRLLGETAREAWRPAAVMDGEVQAYRDQIVRHLQSRAMPTHAALFAKANQLPDRLQWYTDIEGPVEDLATMPTDRQQAIVNRVLQLLDDVRREGARLGSERSASLRALGDLLVAALAGTSTLCLSDVHVVDGQPVIAWGVRPVMGKTPVNGLFGQGTVPLQSLQPVRSDPVDPMPEVGPPERDAEPSLLPAGTRNPPPGERAALASADLPPIRSTPTQPARRRWVFDRRPLEWLGVLALLVFVAFPLLRWVSRPGPVRPLMPADIAAPPPQSHGARSSPIEVSLAWTGPANLDLHVSCPDETLISRVHRSACGGTREAAPPVAAEGRFSIETVAWPNGAEPGTYLIAVEYVGVTAQSPQIAVVVRIAQDGTAQDFHKNVHGFYPVKADETVGAFVVR